jgi:ElaA protein
MEWVLKNYKELTKEELYGLLRLRAEVFVVEQDCPYQDLDNKDQLAHHLLGKIDNQVAAYLRIFKAGDYFQEISIGRVVVKPSYRSMGLGHKLMQQAILFIEQNSKQKSIRISAQTYLKNFYESHGFKQIGEAYLEDGLPHIGMLRK